MARSLTRLGKGLFAVAVAAALGAGAGQAFASPSLRYPLPHCDDDSCTRHCQSQIGYWAWGECYGSTCRCYY